MFGDCWFVQLAINIAMIANRKMFNLMSLILLLRIRRETLYGFPFMNSQSTFPDPHVRKPTRGFPTSIPVESLLYHYSHPKFVQNILLWPILKYQSSVLFLLR